MTSDKPEEANLERAGRACVLMAKVPVAGQVKTRLLPYLDEEASAGLYACFLSDMAASIEAALPGLCRVAYTPSGEGELLKRFLPAGCPLVPQRGSHLGERLYNLFHYLLLSEGLGSALAVNSDSPTLPMSLVAEAFARLEEPGVECVLGPAEDGGYYLIGLKRPQKHLFHDIPWSTSEVLSKTLERAREARLEVVTLDAWYDVDDGECLLRLLRELESEAGEEQAPATRAFLDRLEAEGGLDELKRSLG